MLGASGATSTVPKLSIHKAGQNSQHHCEPGAVCKVMSVHQELLKDVTGHRDHGLCTSTGHMQRIHICVESL